MTQEELQAIRELVNKATPGPWSVDSDDCITSEAAPTGRVVYPGDRWLIWDNENDKTFIAWAREGVPRLLDEVERLRGVLDFYAKANWAALKDIVDIGQAARHALDGDTA
jgi:hypothetical protein